VQARAEATRAAILVAAAQVLSRRGYDGTTTNHVASRAGVSIGTLYEYFRNKEQLVAAVMDAHLTEGEALVAAKAESLPPDLLSRPLEELVAFVVHAIVELHRHDPALHRVLSSEVPRDRRVVARVTSLEQRIVERVAILLRLHPEVRAEDVPLAARLCVDAVDALTHRWIIDGDGTPLPAERLEDELVTMLVAYLKSETRKRSG